MIVKVNRQLVICIYHFLYTAHHWYYRSVHSFQHLSTWLILAKHHWLSDYPQKGCHSAGCWHFWPNNSTNKFTVLDWFQAELASMILHEKLGSQSLCGYLWQLYTAFICQYFPGLCDPGPQKDSLVDKQSKHWFYNGKWHDGQLIGNVPQSLSIDMMKARKHGTMSWLLHIIFRLSTPSEECKPLLKDFHFLPSVRNDQHALNTAQLQVLMEYGILHHGRGPPVALQANTHPYLELVCYSFIFTQSTMLTSCTASKMWQWPWRCIQVFHMKLFWEGGSGWPVQ